jgi:hypothetical protein
MALCLLAAMEGKSVPASKNIIAEPGDAGLRAAIASAQDGDTVILTRHVELLSPIRINKRLTLRSDSDDPYSASILGNFSGELFQIAAEGIVFEFLRLYGTPQTDGVLVETDLVLRDCVMDHLRHPISQRSFWAFPNASVRLVRVTVWANQTGLECVNLEAKDCNFSFNGGYIGAAGWTANMEGCRFENNQGDGFSLTYGAVKNCTFRFNGGFGLRFDPDPGVLSLSGSLFYANAGGGVFLGEEAVATVDNCTFTRHTGMPAVIVAEAHDVLFRHCTVADNVFISSVAAGAWPPERYGGSFAIPVAGRVELQNCIVADNPTNTSPHASGLTGSWIDGGGNVIGGPARLGALRDNGGPTLSLLPMPDSPAIDAGRPSDLVRDARGLSRLAGISPDAGAVEADAPALADADGDGLPDIWEVFHGLDPTDPADAASDRDADGHNALTEFKTGTDPNDSRSVLRFEEVILASGTPIQPFPPSFYFEWSFSPGVTYQVETSADLRQWRKAPDGVPLYHKENGHPFLQFEVQVEPSPAFYRLRVVGSPSD